MPEALAQSEQLALYSAEQIKTFFGVLATPNKKMELVQYLGHWSPQIVRTNQEGGLLSRFLIESRQQLLLPISEVAIYERKRKIFDADDYVLGTDQISADDDEIFKIIKLIRDDAARTTREKEQKRLARLANRIEATIREEEFKKTHELMVDGRQLDEGLKRVNFINDTDFERILHLIANDFDPTEPLMEDDLRILRLLLIDQRQLVILACIYRKYTPEELRKKLRELKLRLIPQEITTRTRMQTNAVFANHLMHLDVGGNIPFDLAAVRSELNKSIGAELY